MARFHFHVRDTTDAALDPEGVELANLAAAQIVALAAARDTLSHEIWQGTVDLCYRIDVDEHGSIVYALALRDAFIIVEQATRVESPPGSQANERDRPRCSPASPSLGRTHPDGGPDQG